MENICLHGKAALDFTKLAVFLVNGRQKGTVFMFGPTTKGHFCSLKQIIKTIIILILSFLVRMSVH